MQVFCGSNQNIFQKRYALMKLQNGYKFLKMKGKHFLSWFIWSLITCPMLGKVATPQEYCKPVVIFHHFMQTGFLKKIHDKYNFLRTHGSISEPEVPSCTVSLYLFFAACLLLTLLLLASYFWGFEVSLYFRCRSSFMLRSAVKRDLSLFNALHVGSPVTATWCWRPPTCCWGTSWWGLCWRSATCWRWPTSLAWVVLSWW